MDEKKFLPAFWSAPARPAGWLSRFSLSGPKTTSLSLGLILVSLFGLACRPAAEDRAAIALKSARSQAYEGETIPLTLRLKNKGSRDWKSEGPAPCFLSYHLHDEKGKTLRFDNPRTGLPGMIRPGGEVEVEVRVKAPLQAGNYILEFDLVREGVAWFKDSGSKTLFFPLLVEKRVWPEDAQPLDLSDRKFTAFRSSVAELDVLHRLIRLTLEDNETEFQGRTGRVSAFTAGGGYPQVWLRDAATIMPASRYSYPAPFLFSWIEEHLARQQADGSLFDWVDGLGRADKNTVETDQEASAIQAAYQFFLLAGPAWLEKEIAGEKIIDRLDKALGFVFQARWENELGLIKGAHTADWGDVDIVDSDQQAIYVDEKTHWTVDIYDQSMVYQACLELATMLDALGEKKRASAWRVRAASLRQATNRWLWQEDKGYYRVHRHLDALIHDFDEDAILAMGGNAQAILSGLADRNKALRIIRQALVRQQTFNLSTISGSLLPPYPAGLFKHPAMDEPFEYQNGGQWDWFGGRLVYAMFENGLSRLAREKLLEIVRKNIANRGFYEWDTRDGEGRGSEAYAGSAGSLARALFEGYFGFRLEEKSLTLSPRLGEDEATVHINLPAGQRFLAYDYRLDRSERRLSFRWNGNFPQVGKLRLLVARDFFGLKDRTRGKAQVKVLREGKEIPFLWETLNEDDYIVLDADFGRKDSLLIVPNLRAGEN